MVNMRLGILLQGPDYFVILCCSNSFVSHCLPWDSFGANSGFQIVYNHNQFQTTLSSCRVGSVPVTCAQIRWAKGGYILTKLPHWFNLWKELFLLWHLLNSCIVDSNICSTTDSFLQQPPGFVVDMRCCSKVESQIDPKEFSKYLERIPSLYQYLYYEYDM